MSKTVTIRYTNGQSKKVVLGKESTCVAAEPRGWGSACRALVFKNGLYHCHDCGLVFKKPVLKNDTNASLSRCSCEKLVNFIEWFFDECFGYDCPSSLYLCEKCKRVYKSPCYNREASVQMQESEAARKHVQWYRNHQKDKLIKRIDGALDDARELRETLKQVPKAARQKILKELGV